LFLHDYTKPVECDLRPGSAVRKVQIISATDGAASKVPISEGKLHLTLAPGEGKLLKLTEGKRYLKVVK